MRSFMVDRGSGRATVLPTTCPVAAWVGQNRSKASYLQSFKHAQIWSNKSTQVQGNSLGKKVHPICWIKNFQVFCSLPTHIHCGTVDHFRHNFGQSDPGLTLQTIMIIMVLLLLVNNFFQAQCFPHQYGQRHLSTCSSSGMPGKSRHQRTRVV